MEWGPRGALIIISPGLSTHRDLRNMIVLGEITLGPGSGVERTVGHLYASGADRHNGIRAEYPY